MERVVRTPRNHVQMSMHDDLPGTGAVRKMQIECIRIQRALDCNADSGSDRGEIRGLNEPLEAPV